MKLSHSNIYKLGGAGIVIGAFILLGGLYLAFCFLRLIFISRGFFLVLLFLFFILPFIRRGVGKTPGPPKDDVIDVKYKIK